MDDLRPGGEELAFALLTATVNDDAKAMDSITQEILENRLAIAEAIATLLKIIQIELSLHAEERSVTKARLVQDVAEAFALLPYLGPEDLPPDDREP